MQFELIPSLSGKLGVFDLSISVKELHKAKSKNANEANEEKKSFNQCLNLYSNYYGRRLIMASYAFDDFLENIGNSGKVVISCLEPGNPPLLCVRLVSNEGVKEIDCKFFPVVEQDRPLY